MKTRASSIHTIEKDIVIKGNENKNIQFIIIWLTLLSNIQFKIRIEFQMHNIFKHVRQSSLGFFAFEVEILD